MNYLLPHSILNAADRQPDHLAFRCGNQEISYSQLAGQMDQLAGLLIELGVQKGDRVGIYLNRCLETAIAVYGIMRAGAAYVPLDPYAPVQRTRWLLNNCGIRCLITQPSQKRTLRKIVENTQLQYLIGLEDAELPIAAISWSQVFQRKAPSAISVRMTAHDLAYIMYTSGSTGAPKGIMHTHYSGLSYARLSAHTYSIIPEDRIGNHAPIYFDISTLGYFTAPLVGATTVIVPDAYTKLPASLSQLMEKEKLTIWYSVPLALVQLLQKGILEDRDMSALRWVLFGGESFPPKYLRALMQQWPQARFSNVYGPAEVNQCTYYHLDSLPDEEEPVPLGQIWENTQMLIVDENDREVPQGQIGELLIRSATRMQGYWDRPDLTDKAFLIRHTVAGIPEYYYRTGDLVRLDPLGRLQFHGRKDQQVKVRGYRVELEEVESVLSAHRAVSEAAVVAHRVSIEEVMIIAAVRLHEPGSIAAKDLSDVLKAQLPLYAVPQLIIEMDQFPRTGSGKINRPAIREELTKIIAQTHG